MKKKKQPADIYELVKEVTDLPVFYCEDSARFWVEAEQHPLPCVGLFAPAGMEAVDNFGVIRPKIEVHIITDGGAFADGDAPSRNVADGRKLLSELQFKLRPYVMRIPQQAGFGRKGAIYSNWCSLEFRDPQFFCV